MNSLAPDTLEEIVSYVDSHQTLVSLLCTCHSLNAAASNPSVWDRLGLLRWSHTWNKSVISMSTESKIIDNPQKFYRERHKKDREVYDWIKKRAVTLDIHSPNGCKTDNLSMDPDKSYDLLQDMVKRSFARRNNDGIAVKSVDKEFCPFRISTLNETCLATELFVSLHFQTVLYRCYELMISNPLRLRDDEVLEEGAILLSESLWTSRDLVQLPTEKVESIRESMKLFSTELEKHLQQEFPVASVEDRALAAVRELAVKFRGNTSDYYNVSNSSIEQCLKSGFGIPITLAVIYKCLLRRSGIHADVVGLPGHVILGIPGRVYIDVFQSGDVLSIADCQHIVASYGVPWDDSFLHPLETEQIINRMLNNIMNCQSRLVLVTSKAAEKTMILHRILNERSRQTLARWPPRQLLIDSETVNNIRRSKATGHCG